MLWLGDFNQQTLLHNTRERFAQDKIYSFIGMPILIAVNPYKHLQIYTEEDIKYYKKYFAALRRNPNEVEAPLPHLYHIGEAAYQDMINEKKNQSIVISGESGSGKTQSTKIILKYLAVSSMHSSDGSSAKAGETVTVEKQVLDSNPLMEAFGNAKTVRNNNSSRFGKFINVNFTEHGKILSARIYNYLLEKSRVISIQPEERNYHIFYQIIKGADANERKKHFIKDLDYYSFLNKGCFEVDETDDKMNFLETKECMQKLKFKSEEMSYIFNIIMGILYLGNVDFVEGVKASNPVAEINPDSLSDFKYAAELLGLSEDKLKAVLTLRKMKDPMSDKIFERNLSVDKAYGCRDAIAKSVYAKMFDYIIGKVNKAINNKEEMSKYDKDKIRKIGLLDIFGFENFDNNSFEQLCINYANERLQQFFNNHIFKLEQEEYKKEGIDWSNVDFVDNKSILDLIDDSKLSLFTILDSEGITPNATDDSFRKKVYTHLCKSQCLIEYAEEYISIDHYAGAVDYYIDGFIEKNLDQLTPDILEALEKSKNKVIRMVFSPKKDEDDGKKKKSSSSAPNKLQSDSLSKQFKKQLDELMKMLSQSNPRYVKCIKPNPEKKPKIIHSHEVMEQLLSAGVLEAIKIRKQGYSIRRTCEEFVKRYHPLTPSIDLKYYEANKELFREALLTMLKLLSQNPDIRTYLESEKKLIQIGLTKVFMKEEVKHILESKLSRIRYVVRIQSTFRGLKIKRSVRKYLKSVKKIQALWRGIETRLFVIMLRQTVKLQKFIRFFLKKKLILKNLKKLALENIKIKEAERQMELERQREEERLRLEKEREKDREREQDKEKERERDKEMSKETYTSENMANSFNIEEGIRNNKVVTNKTNSKTTLKQIERQSCVSNKGSLGDISTSDVQLCNELGALKSNKNMHYKKNSKNTYADLLHYNLDSAHEEMRLKLEALTEELGLFRKEKETLISELTTQKEETRRKEKEIEILKSNNDANSLKAQLDNFSNNVDRLNTDLSMTRKNLNFENNNMVTLPPQCDHMDELRKLKKEVTDKEGYVDILNLKIDELTKSNVDLLSLNESLKDQLNKRTEKMNREMTILYSQIKDLELKKSEFERLNRSLIDSNLEEREKEKERFDSSILSTPQTPVKNNDKALQELKSENKQLNKKIEEIKSKYEKEISSLKNEIFIKENRIKETDFQLTKIDKELKEKTDSYSLMKDEYNLCKEKIREMKVKLENLNKNSKLQEYEQEINKMKMDFDSSVKKKDTELQELKETVELNCAQIERLKKMEKALKNELNTKNDDLNKRQEMLREARQENDKLMDESMSLKKENFSLSAKLEVLEIEYKNKFESENKIRQNEVKTLREKESKYEKLILEMKETLKKKQRIIENKKRMNLMLVDLAKIKKGEVQCLETLHYTNSANIKETLIKIRENEKELLSRLQEISSNPDNTDSEDDFEDEEDDGIIFLIFFRI